MDFNINQLLETTKYVFESTNFTYETTGWYIDEDDHGHFFGIINLASKMEKTPILTTLKRSILTSHFHLPKRTI
ncbi:MAG: hypothetical protein RI922_1831 [Bacteroidota bacterium]|jgi:hypothetical protein